MMKLFGLPKISRYFTTKKHFSTSIRKGLVLGVQKDDSTNSLTLTPAAKKFDDLSNGRLSSQLNYVKSEIKPAKSFVFWGLHEDYPAIAVTGLSKTDSKKHLETERIDFSRESARKAAASGCAALTNVGIKNIEVEALGAADAAAEGAILSTWTYQEFKTKKKDLPAIEAFHLDEAETKLWKRGYIYAEAQNLARKLTDTPSNHLTPTTFSETVKSILSSPDTQVEIHDKTWAENEKMGAYLSVARGSKEEPKFLEITYNNNPGTPPSVLVGKGVTFDSGGISIKPSANMDHMRGDMGGAATVVATLYAIQKLEEKINLKVLVPLVENMPSGSATKPGDIVTAKNGKTIAVLNTDAEGRLILADALCYASKFVPAWIVDVATLTGAVAVALGSGATGAFTNSDRLYRTIEKVGLKTGDRVWRLPLWQHYTEQINKNSCCDLDNIGPAGTGGSCTAAAFLREFVSAETPWMHLDIAGVFGPKPDSTTPYLGKGMTGRPTRTLIEFVSTVNQDLK